MRKIKFIALYAQKEEKIDEIDKCCSFLQKYDLKYGIKKYEEEINDEAQLSELKYDVNDGLVSLVIVSKLSHLSTTKEGLKTYINFFKKNDTGLVSLEEGIKIGFQECIK